MFQAFKVFSSSYRLGFSEKKHFLDCLNYVPGLVILVFGMLALHFSVGLMETNRSFIGTYKEYSHDILQLEDSYNEFRTNFLAVLSEAKYVDDKALMESYGAFLLLHQEILLKAQLSKSEHRPEKYIEQLQRLQSDLAELMEVVTHRHEIVGDERKAAAFDTLSKIYKNIEELGYNFYSDEQQKKQFAYLKQKESWLYWSVIAIGLSGFVLVILNTEKLQELKKVNKERREALTLLENRLAAMEASSDGIGIVDGDGNVTYMNKALRAMYGIPERKAGEYIGRRWGQFYKDEARKNIEENILPVLEGRGYWRGENTIITLEGKEVQTELSLTRLVDGGFLGTARDISERAKAEKEKQELQDQFFQAQKMEAIGRLAGGIAHDFNNILAAMNGYAEFLYDDLEEDTPQHKFAQNILQAGRHARGLVDQLLAFSRRKDRVNEILDLRVPVKESLAMLEATLPKTIEVKTDISLDIDSATIEGNENQISQTIMNLCVNAIDAMEDEKGALEIGLEIIGTNEIQFTEIVNRQKSEGDKTLPIRIVDVSEKQTRLFLGKIENDQNYVCVRIGDTGCGMSRAIMSHIFEPFFTTKPVDKGTGLGLATVHGVISSHQGAMVVDSVIGQGTCFYLYFPLVDEVENVKTQSPNSSVVQSDGGTILLVEDQEEVREMMTHMLERLGYDAFACENGIEALSVLRENPDAFDLILTDQNMPKMTGIEMIAQAHMDFPALPFIVLSGYSQQKLQEIINEHPAIKEVLRKPIAKEELARKIEAVLAQVRKAA